MNDKNKKILENDSNEQVLSYYADNRIKLMQEVLSLIKPKKIMSMAPDFMKSMQLSVVKSLLLEELLGISNKRLRNILAGENVDIDTSSSSDSEIEENKCADIDTLSLQEISDDSDCCIDIQLSEQERLELEKDNANLAKSETLIKSEPNRGEKRKDTGKHKKRKTSTKKIPKIEAEPVVNVLNLLELQARARAIRSQLANEMLLDKDVKSDVPTAKEINSNKPTNEHESDEDSSNSVICISPDNLSVVSVASNSDLENSEKNQDVENNADDKSVTSDKNKNDSNPSKTVSNCEKNGIEEEKDESNTEAWKTRWLESKKVQDVMKTTKLYNSLRQSRKQKNISSEETNVENINIEINNDTVDKNSTSEPSGNDNAAEEAK